MSKHKDQVSDQPSDQACPPCLPNHLPSRSHHDNPPTQSTTQPSQPQRSPPLLSRQVCTAGNHNPHRSCFLPCITKASTPPSRSVSNRLHTEWAVSVPPEWLPHHLECTPRVSRRLVLARLSLALHSWAPSDLRTRWRALRERITSRLRRSRRLRGYLVDSFTPNRTGLTCTLCVSFLSHLPISPFSVSI